LNAAVDLGWLLKVPRIRKPSVRAFSADYRYLRTIVAHQRQRDDFREGPGRLDFDLEVANGSRKEDRGRDPTVRSASHRR
jgi:hypothetical protein